MGYHNHINLAEGLIVFPTTVGILTGLCMAISENEYGWPTVGISVSALGILALYRTIFWYLFAGAVTRGSRKSRGDN